MVSIKRKIVCDLSISLDLCVSGSHLLWRGWGQGRLVRNWCMMGVGDIYWGPGYPCGKGGKMPAVPWNMALPINTLPRPKEDERIYFILITSCAKCMIYDGIFQSSFPGFCSFINPPAVLYKKLSQMEIVLEMIRCVNVFSVYVNACNPCNHGLTHRGWDEMAAISLMTFSNSFCWIKIVLLWFKFHWSSQGSN